jgi:hypothetical protein
MSRPPFGVQATISLPMKIAQLFQHLPLAKDWASAVGLLLAIGGGILAIISLHNNTVSLRGNIRGQMYAEERQLSQREYADSTGTLYSIYTDYPTKGVSTVDYVQSRLKPLLYNDMEGTYTQCATAEELQAALFGVYWFSVNWKKLGWQLMSGCCCFGCV